jgi:hypothetical protein
MKEITMPEYILDNAIDAIRIAANILESRTRETAADRQIEFSERLLKWVKEGKQGEPPRWIP